jgi:transposase
MWPSLEKRLAENLATSTRLQPRPGQTVGCLLWAGTLDRGGYAIIFGNGKQLRVSRIMYEREHGPLPEGQYVLHHCDTPQCVESACLFLGTKADNNEDMAAKRRGRSYILTEELERFIQRDRANGMSLRELVKKYKVASGTVYNALQRDTSGLKLLDPRPRFRSTARGTSVLSKEQCLAVQADRALGMSLEALASKYGVAKGTIYRALRYTMP